MVNKTLIWLVVVAVVLGIVSALLFFFGGSSFSEGGVSLALDGPTQASVGDEVTYKVRYENNTKTTLHRPKLSFSYPANAVIIKDGTIQSHSGNVVETDEQDLPPGAFQEKEFRAFLVGDKGNIKIAKVRLSFDAGDIKSPFEKDAQLATTITDIPVSLSLIGPPDSTSGQSVSYIVDYRNQSADDISGLQITVSYPDGFRQTKITPAASAGNNVWDMPLVKKGAGGRITIQGALSGREGESKVIEVSLKKRIDDGYINYYKSSVSTIISSPLLSLTTTVNGSPGYISHPGDTLQYAIRYSNNSNFTLTGLTLSAKLEGAMYDFASLDPKGGFYNSSERTISWNSTAVSDFNSLPPRASGTVNFTVKLKPSSSGGSSSNLFARALIQLSTPNVPDTVSADQIVVADDVITKITSQPTFRQTVYYNDPAFGSSGLMPPQVGKETVFTIHWLLTNPGNSLNNAKITATLPQGVSWKNVISVGAGQPQPSYNKNTSQVSWSLGTLPSGVGIAGTAGYELAFQVGLKPSSTQVGLPAPILNGVSLSGVDSFTQQNIVVNNYDLTTNSTIDQPGQGVVVE